MVGAPPEGVPPLIIVTTGLLPIKEAYVSVATHAGLPADTGSEKKFTLLSFFSTVYPIA